jgi:tryptophan synthase alpha chain
MLERLNKKLTDLKQKEELGLSIYICAGDGGLDFTYELALSLIEAGADILELGVPFSDPLADGPVIQAASQRALAGGSRLPDILEMSKALRAKTDAPLVLMGYYNPFYNYGLSRLAKEAKEAGVDAFIVPDLPLEENGPFLKELNQNNLGYIPLVAPTTDNSRLFKIAAFAKGFIYCVSVTGVTGARNELSSTLPAFLQKVRNNADAPLFVGFGISKPEHIRELKPFCDGVVVGSAVVSLAAEGRQNLPRISELIRSLKEATS